MQSILNAYRKQIQIWNLHNLSFSWYILFSFYAILFINSCTTKNITPNHTGSHLLPIFTCCLRSLTRWWWQKGNFFVKKRNFPKVMVLCGVTAVCHAVRPLPYLLSLIERVNFICIYFRFHWLHIHPHGVVCYIFSEWKGVE